MEAIPKDVVTYAVTEAIQLGASSFDAVKQIALARVARRPARPDLSVSPSAEDQYEGDIGGRLRGARSGESGMTVKGSVDAMPGGTTSGTPQVLLGHHLKQLKLPTVPGNMTRSPANAPVTASTIPAIYFAWSNWN